MKDLNNLFYELRFIKGASAYSRLNLGRHESPRLTAFARAADFVMALLRSHPAREARHHSSAQLSMINSPIIPSLLFSSISVD
jgi:hypothetical protein